MEYIKPLNIEYLDTNVTDEAYSTWNSSTTYSVGTRVIYNYKYYEATAENINQNPEEFNTTKTDLAVWSSPTVVNTKRCLDVTTNGRTTGTDEIYYKFPYQGYSTITILQTKATTLEIKIYDSSNNLLHTIDGSFIEDFRSNYVKWRDGTYFFKDSIVVDTPFYPNGSYVEIRVKGVGSISIGFLLFGDKNYLGSTSVDIGRENRAINPTFTDDLGNMNIVENPIVFQYIDIECFITPDKRREVIKNLQRIVGKVALFISTGIEEFNDLNTLATIKSATDTTKLAGFGDISLELEGFVDVNFY